MSLRGDGMNEQMRVEFEKAYTEAAHRGGWEPDFRVKRGDYMQPGVYWAWWAWKASRAALVVNLPISVCRTHVFELPHTSEVGMEHDEYYEIGDVKKSLDAAGVKFK